MSLRHIFFGAVFGFVLVRAGATSPDAISGMFLLRDGHLALVMAVAIALAGVGFVLLRRLRSPAGLVPKPMQPGLVTGGLLFGAGWALTGTCPGTALAQIGEGRLTGLVTMAGILAGIWLRDRLSMAGPSPAPQRS